MRGGKIQFFCPACFSEINEEDKVCPHCGVAVQNWGKDLSYEDRLIHALGHPISEVRMGAIISLGNIGSEKSSEFLARCALQNPSDIVQGQEILKALEKTPKSKQVKKALRLLAEDPSNIIRQAALRMLQDNFPEK